MARLIVDSARLHTLGSDWVKTNIQCPLLERYRELKLKSPQKGILIATGHLGSFELLAHCMPMFGHPIAFVVRNFKLQKIDCWWKERREAFGNKVINRRGAFKDVIDYLNAGRDVALLFDQNVTQKHAVFVNWFGKPAATTKAIALAAIKTGAPIIVAGIIYRGNEHYCIEAKETNVDDVYLDEELSTEDKVYEITQRISTHYENMICLQPEAWFWVHRRWKTRPEGDNEKVYE